MKHCLACGVDFAQQEWNCPACGVEPRRLHGFSAFAPELASDNGQFDPKFFGELAALEDRNFWFRARNELIVAALARFFPAARRGLEIGCGTGYVLAALERRFRQTDFTGSEIFTEGLAHARSRLKRSELIQMDARCIPFRDEFDLIGCFDVLEHIEADETVLAQIRLALRPGGGILLTVPQHPFLWSTYDEVACHVRRYSRAEMAGKLARAGFRVAWATSFVSLLLPVMLLSRVVRGQAKAADFDVLAELRVSPGTNTLLGWVMNCERSLIRAGARLPWGGSLLMVAFRD